jgi:antitoxin component of MazEF toxin-antitoxin module
MKPVITEPARLCLDNAPPRTNHVITMVKTITKIGNSAGLILDQAVLELARLKVGDRVDISVDAASGVLRVASLQPVVTAEQAAQATERILTKNDELFRRLA